MELVSNPNNRAKNKLEMFALIYINIWSHFISILPRILKKQLKV